MIFLSSLLRQSVYDNAGYRLGGLRDISVALNETFPVVTALVVHPPLGGGDLIIPWSCVHSIEEPRIRLTVTREQIPPYTPQPGELLLRRDILDKQIVDTQGFRVVKVNDLKLAQIKKTARLVGVDISLSGLLRRLGVQAPFEMLGRVLPLKMEERTITWNYVEPIQVVRMGATTGQLTPAMATAGVGASGVVPQVQLNVSHTKLAELRPADIADILEQLDVEEAGAVLDHLDMETAADTLSEIEYPLQSELLSELDPERASDLLEHLAPDDAADILADIPREQAEHLLNLMPVDESQPIRELLRYAAETAGGIMTTEVLALDQDKTVEDALKYLRQHSSHLEMVYYLYIVDEQEHLMGVVSLRQLVTADPTTPMRDLMDTDVISVPTDVDQEEVARIIAKYDLLSVPVVDTDNKLVGLVTVDDVIDVIHEEQAEDFSELTGADVEEAAEEERFSWHSAFSRFSWLAVNIIAGFLLAIILYNTFGFMLNANSALASLFGAIATGQMRLALFGTLCLVPMLLMTSGSAASQALGVAGWQLRSARGKDLWRSIARELQLGTTGGILSSALAGILAWVLFRLPLFGVIVGFGFGITLLAATCCGLLLPNLLLRFRLRGSIIAPPLLDPVIAFISLSIFLIIALTLVSRMHT
jgi:magnesium transporter